MEEAKYTVLSDLPPPTQNYKSDAITLTITISTKISFLRWVGPLLLTCAENPNSTDFSHILYLHQLDPPKLLSIYDPSSSIRDLAVLPSSNDIPNPSPSPICDQAVYITDKSICIMELSHTNKVVKPIVGESLLPYPPTSVCAHLKHPLLYVGCVDGTVLLLNNTLQIISLVKTNNAPIVKAIPSLELTHLFVSCSRGPSMLKVQTFLSPHPVNTIPLHIFMTDIFWDGHAVDPLIVGDALGFVNVIDRSSAAVKAKKQATFTRVKAHSSGCNAVDTFGSLVFSGGDDGRVVVFDKQRYHNRRKRKGAKTIHVLFKVMKENGDVVVNEDVAENEKQLEGYVLSDDDVRIVDLKINKKLEKIAIGVRKGVVLVKSLQTE
ncbi:hypothetical protein EIN_173760 [Entamoeba invadens IP1]|uniref:WD repeat-containing protein n=1 Tax=Entamoeba invadens IP1 TaxID=370355 RepID=A0A0A1TW46_ENTIV|nr:hypothetical protein EIN_173760 [Entamoeba invadens IP1]ELP84701.1 hypothetical protein EIN_173760 [Entamoeba invadens IP1]|eukprot:XP_004184047.1 hypothetical protein EIN_173760 [Entamoeba invadens IP1]